MGLADKLSSMKMIHAIFMGTAIAATYYYVFLNDGSDLVPQIKQRRAEISQKTASKEEGQAKLGDRKRFEQEVNTLSTQFREALAFLPTDINMSEFIGNVNTQARAVGAKIVRVEQRSQGKMQKGYEEFFIDVELEGRFTSLIEFLTNVAKIPQMISVGEFAVTSINEEGPPVLSLKAILTAYRYVEVEQR